MSLYFKLFFFIGKREQRKHSGVDAILYIKSSVILLNMGVSVEFGLAENEAGRGLRSSEKLNLALGMRF